jgi:hypothetical protein
MGYYEIYSSRETTLGELSEGFQFLSFSPDEEMAEYSIKQRLNSTIVRKEFHFKTVRVYNLNTPVTVWELDHSPETLEAVELDIELMNRGIPKEFL